MSVYCLVDYENVYEAGLIGMNDAMDDLVVICKKNGETLP